MSENGTKSGTTVYDDLLKRVRQSIARGELKPGEFIGSEYEMARESGISRVSVRRATDVLIGEGLVERRPGKGLFVRPPSRSMRVVQVVVPDMSFDQCVQIARGAQAVGMERGVQIQAYDAHSRLDWDVEMLRRLPETDMDGAIIVSWHDARFAEVLYELKRQGYPFVLVDEQLQDIDVPSVVADNHGGGYAVGKALVAEGHTRIAFIGSLGADTVRARLDGLRDAVNDAGIAFDRARAFDLATPLDGDWESAIRQAVHQAIDRPDRATAIFCADDQTAAHTYTVLKAAGLRIPEDISVAGFDDNPLGKWLVPSLATVRQASTDMGTVAMEMLLEMLGERHESKSRDSRDGKGAQRHRVLPTQWIPRGSVGKAPARPVPAAQRRQSTQM